MDGANKWETIHPITVHICAQQPFFVDDHVGYQLLQDFDLVQVLTDGGPGRSDQCVSLSSL